MTWTTKKYHITKRIRQLTVAVRKIPLEVQKKNNPTFENFVVCSVVLLLYFFLCPMACHIFCKIRLISVANLARHHSQCDAANIKAHDFWDNFPTGSE